MSAGSSGSSTPLSETTTLSCPPSPPLKYSYDTARENVFKKALIPSSHIIEYISSRSALSSTIYVYDLAEQAGFGTLTKSWSASGDDTSPAISLQTREGAGLSLVGRLSEGVGESAVGRVALTAYTTPHGLAAMSPSLSLLPTASLSHRLVIQVPRVTPVEKSFTISPSLAPLVTVLPLLPENVVILLSATPQESVDLTSVSYALTAFHVVHIFDHFSTSREIGHTIVPPLPFKSTGSPLLQDIITQSGYNFFDYSGDPNAHTIVVLLNGPLALAIKNLSGKVSGLGVIVVRVLRPWNEAALCSILPSTVKDVHILDDVPHDDTQGPLYTYVLGTMRHSYARASIHPHRITLTRTLEYIANPSRFVRSILDLLPNAPTPTLLDEHATLKKLLFFSPSDSPLFQLPTIIESTFLSNKSISAHLLTDHDVFSKSGGITADRIVLDYQDKSSGDLPIPLAFPLATGGCGESDFLGVLDHNLLKSHSLLRYAKPSSAVLIITHWSSVELSSNLPSDVISLILERNLRIFTIDAKGLASELNTASASANDAIQNVLAHLAFMRLYIGAGATEFQVHTAIKKAFNNIVHGVELSVLNSRAWTGLRQVAFSSPHVAEGASTAKLKEFAANAIVMESDEGGTMWEGMKMSHWHDAAKHILFPSVFSPPCSVSQGEYYQDPALRPEIPDRTFLVTCTVNRRLTPLDYDRNVFHIEFDTSGTGLKYVIGEALGVHGWNDEQEVLDFCNWYGIEPCRLVTIPIRAKDSQMHTRTVLQALQQQIDLFGRPPKSFYTDLAKHATNAVDKYALLFIGSPEGSATFQKLSEKDTVTFADVLRQYSSARPSIEILCEIVGDIKPRHYSIASAQSAVGDRVDLLVVTLEWVTPSGNPRYGQCTKYLAGLNVGQKVTVSIKPSVMKLPPDNSQPLIMAGLGTGAAPFRAFLQHRAWLAQRNISVGPVYYYFGSRHQSQEYLYGEEIEAYILNGVIDRAGLAFSRDGPNKVYIQHKMLEDAEALAQMLHDENGVFYLCGPTWPVPDVYEALVGALVKYKGYHPEAAGAFLEGLKEDERYVLEVY